jgi:ABC-type Mn2+/Zn2+ transport system ATPase subunit
MDEPLAGLDIPSQEATLDILHSLRPDKVTVLLATHDLGVAAERFDRVMLLHKQIVALGPATAVFTTANLATAYGGHIPAHSNGAAQPIAAGG